MKKLEVVIYTTGYWRSYFLKNLFSNSAYIKIFDFSRNDSFIEEKADFYLWEKQIQKRPFEYIPGNSLFLFDYEAEGNRDKLLAKAKKWGIENPRFLLLFPLKKDKDTFPLPLPPPTRLKKTYYFKPKRLKDRKKDTFFLGAPTFIALEKKNDNLPFTSYYDEDFVYNQRLEWVSKLNDAGMISQNEGLLKKKNYLSKKNMEKLFAFKKDLFVDPIPKVDFYKRLLNTKLVFSPGGHS